MHLNGEQNDYIHQVNTIFQLSFCYFIGVPFTIFTNLVNFTPHWTTLLLLNVGV